MVEGESSQKPIKIDSKIRDELVEWLETDEAKELGFNSMARFATLAISKELKSLKQKRFEHFNFAENVIRLIDNEKPAGTPYVEIALKNEKLYCRVCESQNCIHIEESWNNDEISKQLKRKNLKKLVQV